MVKNYYNIAFFLKITLFNLFSFFFTIPAEQIWRRLIHLNRARANWFDKKTFFPNWYNLSLLSCEVWSPYKYQSNRVCLVAAVYCNAKSLRDYFFYEKLNKEFTWNFVFPMRSRLWNHWKCCRRVLVSLFYHEQKYLSDTKH